MHCMLLHAHGAGTGRLIGCTPYWQAQPIAVGHSWPTAVCQLHVARAVQPFDTPVSGFALRLQ